MLGGPHRVVPEGVAVLGIRDEVGIHPLVVGLAIVPPVCRWPVDAGVRHIHGPVEEGAEMHLSLRSLGAGVRRGPYLLGAVYWAASSRARPPVRSPQPWRAR